MREIALTEVELHPMTARLPTFDSSVAPGTFAGPIRARPGSSLRQGPHIALSGTWLASVHGLEYIQLYLWLGKDFAWSQLHWVYPGIIFGVLAMLWSLMLLLLALSARLYSEAYLAIGMVLWLGANFVWMVGEFWQENFLEDGEEFYNICLELGQSFAAAAVALLALYFMLLMPLGVFEFERRSNPVFARLSDDAPPPRLRWLFTTFREYETLHLLFWSIKDMCWIYELPHGYMFGFVPTVLLNLDLLYLFATHKDQYIDFMHSLSLLFWVVANGAWAYGEMLQENPNDDLISDDDWDAYDWPLFPGNRLFLARYFTGFLFLGSVLTLVTLYVHWAIVTVRCPPREEVDEDWDSTTIGKVPTYESETQDSASTAASDTASHLNSDQVVHV